MSTTLNPTNRPAASRPNALHILIADDEADMRLYLSSCLHGFGLEPLTITEASSGQNALRLARTLLPDLVISDVVMPGLDGQGLCRALKDDPATAAIPILIVSGETRAPPTGADGFLPKPFNASSLRAAVEQLLDGPR